MTTIYILASFGIGTAAGFLIAAMLSGGRMNEQHWKIEALKLENLYLRKRLDAREGK